ncbi:MAG: Uma2 family endonuclease, partial [Gammaproteobacteria bacterium]
MVEHSERLTAEEFYAHPGRDGAELVRGMMRVSEPPGGFHGVLAGRLAAKLVAHVEQHGLGTVLVESGYLLRRDPDTVRGPDLSFITAARLPADRMPIAFIPIAPDLAIEVLSPEDRPGEIEERIADFLEAGTRMVWVVDPSRRRVLVHRRSRPPRMVGAGGALDGEDVVPGFRLSMVELFGGAPMAPSARA